MPEPRRYPPTTRGLADGEIERLIRQARLDRGASRLLDTDSSASPLPGEIGLQLTNRCNLRCTHCFQWGETGQYHMLAKSLQQQELDLELIGKVLAETRPANSRLYVWGGEPLVYRRFGELMELIAQERRWTVICTNGIGVEKKLDALAPASEHIVMLVSLDGFERQNDSMRTRGAFDKTVASIRALVEAKKAGKYNGEISVATVISDDLIEHLHDFTEFVQSLGVNTLHFNFPWYISAESAHRMDAYYAANFEWLRDLNLHSPGPVPSWHSYSYHLDRARLPELQRNLAKLYEHSWSMRVKIQPLMTPAEVEAFVDGSESAPAGRRQCVSIATRISVLPNGRVTTCKLFPEFTVGDLNSESLGAIWNGEPAVRTRQILSRGLTPVCSRCVQLYLNRPKEMVQPRVYA